MRDKAQTSEEKKATRKRKATEQPAGGSARTKRVRGKRGSLNKILDMPTDVLFEIFRFLEPVELLHLSRSSKDLRSLLMTRSSIFVWKAARSNVPHMPDCPPDLSEPQYADLAFGKHCHFCGRNLARNYIFWSARLRTCTKCLKDSENFVEIPNFLRECCPTTYQPGTKASHGRWVAPRCMVFRYREEYLEAKDKQAWLAEKRRRQKNIDLHAQECSIWSHKLDTYRAEELAVLVSQRRSAVVQLIHKLGWDEELSLMPTTTPKLEEHPVVTKECLVQLTVLSLSFLTDFINTTVQSVRARRLAQARVARLQVFLPKLKEVYEAFVASLPVNAVYPAFADLVLQDEAMRRIIDTTPYGDSCANNLDTGNCFDRVLPLFPEIVQRWRTSIEHKVRSLVAGEQGCDYTDVGADVLALATTWFSCTQCYALLHHPRVLVHKCATQSPSLAAEAKTDTENIEGKNTDNSSDTNSSPLPPPDPYTDPDPNMTADPDRTVVERLFHQVEFNTGGCICVVFSPHLMECMEKVIKSCGLDPERTTAQEMDNANPVVECLACDDPRKGRAMMTWAGVPYHYQNRHRSSTSAS